MNDNAAGSYKFGAFSQNESELERLQRQASTTLSLEQAILRQVGLAEGMNVLDLACGPGILSGAMAQIVNPGCVTGVDLSEELISVAKKHNETQGISNVSFQTGNVYDLHLSADSFDFVYARFLFQHLESPETALQNIIRVMKPSGILCAVDVDDDWLMLYPESELFRSFTEKAGVGQKLHGGDRSVGRKFNSYFQKAGLKNTRTRINTITSHDLGLKNFLDITTGFKLEQLLPEDYEEGVSQLQQIYAAAENPVAWGAVGVFIATGVK